MEFRISWELLDRYIEKDQYLIHKRAIWIYLILLIFEGALRKWFLTPLATPLLLCREPIVFWLVWEALRRGWIRDGIAQLMMIITVPMFLISLAFGHHTVSCALFGARIYFCHFPMMFIIGKVLTRKDLLTMGKFILYCSIPMTMLIMWQFYSPMDSWVNRGVGGEGTASYLGAMGFNRSSGTFSFTSGVSLWLGMVGAFMGYFLLMNNYLTERAAINKYVLFVALGFYMLAIPFSISRTAYYQCMVECIFLVYVMMIHRKMQSRAIQTGLFVIVAAAAVMLSGWLDDSSAAFSARIDEATEIEGGVQSALGGRYAGGFLNAVFNSYAPLWGVGLGAGTSTGAQLLGGSSMFAFMNGENEWGRVMNESGYVFGLMVIALRCAFGLDIFIKSHKMLNRGNDMLPWMLCVFMLLNEPQGQLGVPTNLGFAVISGGFALAACNTHKTR